MKLRLLFTLFFLAALVLSAAFGLQAGQHSSGWLMAAIVSTVGLAWTAWGEQPGAAQRAPRGNNLQPGEATGALGAPLLAQTIVEAPAANAQRPGPADMASKEQAFVEYFERAPVPLMILDRDGHIERMNRAAESVTEFATAEVRSLPYWSYFLEEADAAVAATEYRTTMLEKQAAPRREIWRTRMGAQAHFEWWRTILKDDFGLATGVLAAALPPAPERSTVDMSALADQLTAVNGYSEFLLMSMDKENPIRGDVESIHRAGQAACTSLRPRTAA